MKKHQWRPLLPLFISAAMLAFLVAGLCFFFLAFEGQNSLADERTKRASGDENREFVFHNKLHRVLWTRSRSKSVVKVDPRKDLLDRVFISVKTSAKFHKDRVEVILKTWFKLAKRQTWFFTDAEDPAISARSDGHLVNTKCSSSHNRSALCCKMAAEIRAFLSSDKSWFCHFDDDNYVNIPKLVSVLGKYDVRNEWYLGKTSISTPLEVMDRGMQNQWAVHHQVNHKKIAFWFATGGAGFCLSRPVLERMSELLEKESFETTGENIRLPDDVTLGYIVEHKLGVPLTTVKQFHSHLEALKLIPNDELSDQISFSYAKYPNQEENSVSVPEISSGQDPTRFVSLHCFLFPGSIKECL